jgi:hypothetical protein
LITIDENKFGKQYFSGEIKIIIKSTHPIFFGDPG